MKLYKRYIEVDVHTDKYGNLTPIAIYWDDGKRYEVDKILEKPRQKASPVGGCGILYVCKIQGQVRNIYFEQGYRWFIESFHP